MRLTETMLPGGLPRLMRVGRAYKGWSQRQLAQAIERPLWWITKIELEIIKPTDEQFAQILTALELPGVEPLQSVQDGQPNA